MPRQQVLQRRLARIEEYLGALERARRYSETEFLADPERYGSAERFLQLTIEALIDIGTHVIAEKALGEVRHGRDIPALLQRAGYVDATLAERWIRMIGFRNILVHEYLEIDRKVVYHVLHYQLDDIRALAGCFAQLLD